MLPYIVSTNKIKNGLQLIQNKALKSIYRLNKRTNKKLLHVIANKETIAVVHKKQALKDLQKAQQNNNTIVTFDKKRESTNNHTIVHTFSWVLGMSQTTENQYQTETHTQTQNFRVFDPNPDPNPVFFGSIFFWLI